MSMLNVRAAQAPTICLAFRNVTMGAAQPHFVLIEEAGIVRKTAIVCGLEISVAEAADAEFMQVVVPPVEGRLDCEMEFAQAPGAWHDKPSPDRRVDPGQRNSYPHGVRHASCQACGAATEGDGPIEEPSAFPTTRVVRPCPCTDCASPRNRP